MAFWLLESALHAYIFDAQGFLQALVHMPANELWMRLLVILLIFFIASRLERALANRERMIAGLQACQLRLQDEATHNREALDEQQTELVRMGERERLARELHDTVSQTLFSTGLLADSTSRLITTRPEEAQGQIEQIRRNIRSSLAELRILLMELRPSDIAHGNLGDLLRQMARSIGERDQVSVDVNINGECNPPPDRKVAIYRIAQEALNNALKHATARCIRIRLGQDDGTFLLSVEDDGTGFDPSDLPMGNAIGLEIMKERARLAGVSLDIRSTPDRGTQVTASWREARPTP